MDRRNLAAARHPFHHAGRRAPVRGGALVAAAGVLLAGCSAGTTGTEPGTGGTSASSSARVQTVLGGLDHPWDVSFFKNGDMLTTQRPGTITLRTAAGKTNTVKAPLDDLFVQSEGGLEGLVIDPTTTHTTFYTCQTHQKDGEPVDARVIRWALSPDGTSATREKAILTGLPVTSGRHSGCRLRFVPGHLLAVATGDAADGTNPQDLNSLGGKILRVGTNGEIPKDNPFYSRGGNARYVTSYGHRNLQGIAVRPGTGQVWTQEQGSSRDDETNLLRPGGNYGWDPVPGYDESVPMTNTKKCPDAVPAQWSSGSSTVATCGITFLEGSAWGGWNGALAIAELKNEGVRILTLDKAGKVTRDERMPELPQHVRADPHRADRAGWGSLRDNRQRRWQGQGAAGQPARSSVLTCGSAGATGRWACRCESDVLRVLTFRAVGPPSGRSSNTLSGWRNRQTR